MGYKLAWAVVDTEAMRDGGGLSFPRWPSRDLRIS
jgi:hypothetical protein